jgi:hypothetical protein
VRKTSIVLTIALALTLSTVAHGAPPVALPGGVNPKEMNFQPVDTTNLAAPVNSTPSSITLSGILSKFNIPGLYKSKKVSPLPGPMTMPSPALYPSMTYKNSFEPVMPIPAK